MTAVKRVSGHGYSRYRCRVLRREKPCFSDAETSVAQPLPRRMSFAEDVDTLNTNDESPVLSETSPPLTGGGEIGGGYVDVGGGRI